MDNDVRAGDVWRSATGRNIVRVEKIEPNFPGSEWHEVHWRRLTKGYTPTGQSGKCGLRNFTRGRTLVERGGVRVGDVYAGAGGGIRVDSIADDSAAVSRGSEIGRIALGTLSAMTLVERAGKAV